jgi:hypothetical protein
LVYPLSKRITTTDSLETESIYGHFMVVFPSFSLTFFKVKDIEALQR